jgi:hypothetical protein
MDAISSSTSSSSAKVIEGIVRLIAPEDRPGFHEMLAHELRNFREPLPADEKRRVAVSVRAAAFTSIVERGAKALLVGTGPYGLSLCLRLDVDHAGLRQAFQTLRQDCPRYERRGCEQLGESPGAKAQLSHDDRGPTVAEDFSGFGHGTAARARPYGNDTRPSGLPRFSIELYSSLFRSWRL